MIYPVLLASLLSNWVVVHDFYFFISRKPEVCCLNTTLNNTKCYSQIKYVSAYKILPFLSRPTFIGLTMLLAASTEVCSIQQ